MAGLEALLLAAETAAEGFISMRSTLVSLFSLNSVATEPVHV